MSFVSAPPRTALQTSSGRLATAMNPSSAAFALTTIPTHLNQVAEGRYTFTIYSLIRKRKFQEVIRLLTAERQTRPNSRAALSLLAYCYYQRHDFLNAASCYETLCQLYPDCHDYRIHHAQTLYNAGQYEAASSVLMLMEGKEDAVKVKKLQAAIKFQSNDFLASRLIVEQLPPDDPDTLINKGSLLFKEGKFEDALKMFQGCFKAGGYHNELAYYIALCQYVLKQYIPALKMVSEIIATGVKEHPELNIGSAKDPDFDESKYVSDLQTLHESYLVEAFNLKAAIEYQLKNNATALESLAEMPPRPESEIDPVTLHNIALLNMDSDPAGGFEKFHFLLTANPCPPETFGNLLMLYVKHDYHDFAADLMAQFPQASYELLDALDKAYIEAILAKQGSTEESFKKLEEIAVTLVETLRQVTKDVQEARENQAEDIIKKSLAAYDDTMARYIPLVMAQGKLYWDKKAYATVEKIFRKCAEYCSENEAWKLNVAHVLFMQEKYKEAIVYYQPIVERSFEHILDIPAIVVANLCVSYIMTSQNEIAEELMRTIEREEERMAVEKPNQPTYHLCIVNLVIGTLYCAKGNYEFGISRITKSLEPMSKKLSTDTWFYAKRCLVALFEILSKQMLLLKDASFEEIIAFLNSVEMHGKNVAASLDIQPTAGVQPETTVAAWGAPSFDPAVASDRHKLTNTATFEARKLKALYLQLYSC